MMKRLLIALAVCLCVAGTTWAQTVTGPTISGWASQNTPGRLLASGSIAWSLVTLQADTDSSITTAVIDMTGLPWLPGYYLFRIGWAGCVGGQSTTAFNIRAFGHMSSTATAGAGYITNTLYLGSWGLLAAIPLVATIGTNAAGSAPFEIHNSIVANTFTQQNFLPRYMSFTLDKEGATGHWTAGTATIYWEAYSR